jgi:phosphoglycerate dehydrogenase-like enzyme
MIPQASRDAREGRWSSWDPTGWLGVDLKGATVGIVGMGKIGRAVAARLKAFGTRLVFCNRSLLPGQELALGATQINLDELLQISDIVCLHVPLTPDTTNLIDSASFKIMKPGAVLINAARGAVVNTGDLQTALETGQIRAAGLDVTEPEPLPSDHPLYQLENCLITPHIGSATLHTRQTMTRIAIDNLRAGLEGNQLPFCVNPEVFS